MQVVSTIPIREFNGMILGYIDTDAKGNQQARSFVGTILGTYDKDCDCTRKFSGEIITRGNAVAGLIYEAARK